MRLYKEEHIRYIKSLDSKKQDYEYWLSEHLRINGMYWGLAALCCLNAIETFDKAEVVGFVRSCWDNRTGGFGAFPRHDAHLVSTLSGIQILSIYDALDTLSNEEVEKCVDFIESNQLEDGSFQGDRFGEVDTRFIYTALSSLSILGHLSVRVVDPAVEFIKRCYNFDGGFGLCPNAESHAAQVFTCVGALAIVGRIGDLSSQQLDNIGWWLCERQVPEGGLNGRPCKLPDVCYSWWVLSTLSIINKLEWIDHGKLVEFILKTQDPKKGGLSDRPGNEVDVFHTLFGIAGLSLMGFDGLNPIDPVYCMPYEVTKKFKKFPYS